MCTTSDTFSQSKLLLFSESIKSYNFCLSTLHDTREASVLQMEMYAAGHSVQTARENYVSLALAKNMSRMAHDLYRQIIGLAEDRVDAPDRMEPFMGEEQEAMMTEMREGVFQKKKMDFMKYQAKKNELQQPRLGRELTINEKIALVSLVIECEEKHRHAVQHQYQDVLDVFLGSHGSRKRNIYMKKTILRMLDTCPEESQHRKHLEEHLIQRSKLRSIKADMSNPFLAIRQMEMEWAESLMNGLDKLVHATGQRSITNHTLLNLFIEIAEKKNSFDYTLGSQGIKGLVEQALQISEQRQAYGDTPSEVEGVLPSQFHGALVERANQPIESSHTHQSVQSQNLQPLPEVLDVGDTPLVLDGNALGYRMEIDTGLSQVSITTGPGTPVKILPLSEKIMWTDDMKRQVVIFLF